MEIYIFARITLELFGAEKSIYGNNEDLAIKWMQAAMSDEVGIKENKIRIMGNIFEVLKGIIGKILSVLGSSFIHCISFILSYVHILASNFLIFLSLKLEIICVYNHPMVRMQTVATSVTTVVTTIILI